MSDRKTKILHTPFGGLHVILVGDFYQLRCVKGTPFFSNNIQSEKALNGQKLWEKTVNEYIELTENCRFNNAELTMFAKCLHYARTGNNKVNELALTSVQLHQKNVQTHILYGWRKRIMM